MRAGPEQIAECVLCTVFNANIDSLLCYTLESPRVTFRNYVSRDQPHDAVAFASLSCIC
jgi:hypothetical protein